MDMLWIVFLMLVAWVVIMDHNTLLLTTRTDGHRVASASTTQRLRCPMGTETTIQDIGTTTVTKTQYLDNTNHPHSSSDNIIPEWLDPVVQPVLSAGIMYSICGSDRSGNVIADLMYAHAFAFGHHIAFGGSCCLRPIYPTNTTRELLHALGWDALFPFDCPEGLDVTKFRHVRIDGPAMVQSISPLLLHKDTYRIDGEQSYFTPAWRQYIETILKAQRSMKKNSNDDPHSTTTSANTNTDAYEIAVHIRRGDVTPCTHSRRYLPNSHYLALIDQYASDNNNLLDGRKVHVTIYSESETFEPLDVFVERNYTLELDTEDLGQVWKALATADVVILSRSTFSIVPAILNPNIVVATEFENFDPHHVHNGEFDVKMIDGWQQADPALVHASDQIIRDMARTMCEADHPNTKQF